MRKSHAPIKTKIKILEIIQDNRVSGSSSGFKLIKLLEGY